MNHLAILVLVLAACGGKSKPADQAAQPAGPKHTVDPPLGGWSGGPNASPPTTTTGSTVDPPLGGWHTQGSPPPTTTTGPAPAPAPAPPPTAAAGSGAGSAVPPPPSPPTAPPPTVTTTLVAPLQLSAAKGPTACAAHGRDCHVLGAAPTATPAGTTKATITGQLSLSNEHVVACPVDLVDGDRRIASGTLHDGRYEITTNPGHYNVSFERCLGCNPGLVALDLTAGSTATVSLACEPHK